MRNKYIILAFTIFGLSSCEPKDPENEQPKTVEINIPDVNFKYALLHTNSIDVDNDGMGDMDVDLNNDEKIQKSEVEAIQNLILQFDFTKIAGAVDLSGIENLGEMKSLIVTRGDSDGYTENKKTEPVSYDLTDLKKLEFLEINYLYSEFFEKINLTGLENLTEVDLSHNRPSYSSNTEDWENPIYFIDIEMEGCSSLQKLAMINSFLNIDFCEVPTLTDLNMYYLEGGEPGTFDFHCLTRLEQLEISENHIDSLILKNSSVLDQLTANDIGGGKYYSNYPFLEYICIDDILKEYEQIATLADENTVVTTECTF